MVARECKTTTISKSSLSSRYSYTELTGYLLLVVHWWYQGWGLWGRPAQWWRHSGGEAGSCHHRVWVHRRDDVSLSEALGEGVVVDLELSESGILVGSDSHKLSDVEPNGGVSLLRSQLCHYHLHHVLVHCAQQDLQSRKH